MFQSTRPRGTRRGGKTLLLADIVSIHASARDATHTHAITIGRTGFNPRVRAGRDMASQSCSRSRRCFNPRVRAGRDRVISCTW